ncbi:hypothetical protein HJC23_001227 [Cyclotella cryptica]|uniref:Guanylate cyclase domain-containing protein n=1 Tax=Cyclotella cryptica TaxID=29204 RepID=A0ABD3QQF7_9STRA
MDTRSPRAALNLESDAEAQQPPGNVPSNTNGKRRRPKASRSTFLSFANSLMIGNSSHHGSLRSSDSGDVESGENESDSGQRRLRHVDSTSLNADMIDELGESDVDGSEQEGIRTMPHHRARSRAGSQSSVGSSNSDSQRSAQGSLNFLRLFTGHHASKEGNSDIPSTLETAATAAAARRQTRITAFRRYAVGDHVLISNHDLHDSPKLVNAKGFAEWDAAEATTSDERRGPYIYVLAKVKSVHFEEDAQYYTVTRLDNGEDQRADVEYMEPITNQRNIDAAKRALQKGRAHSNSCSTTHVKSRRSLAVKARLSRWMQQIRKAWKYLERKSKKQIDACLSGNKPYSFTCRFTGVNLLVICSIWLLYIDQLRSAFAPHSMDYELAVVSFIVWLILVLELLFELYIRPSDYFSLIKSEKAYIPSTARHITNFHVWTELIALGFFVPEFVCIFGSTPCGHSTSMSLSDSCIMALYGPGRLQAFYGHAFLCLMKLRLFGLVRHWEKMWVNNIFVRVKGKDGVWTVQRGKGLFIPQGRLHAGKENTEAIEEQLLIQAKAESEIAEHNTDAPNETTVVKRTETHTDDYHLTNASKIGTALLMTNAQRGLILIFLIGLQSMVSVVVKENGGTNQQLWTSVDLLQSNNLSTNTTDSESCDFFAETVEDWIAATLYEEPANGEKIIHLVDLVIKPVRCDFQLDPLGITGSAICGNRQLCTEFLSTKGCKEFCALWPFFDAEERWDYLENNFDVRPSMTISARSSGPGSYSLENGTVVETEFSVGAIFNERFSVENSLSVLRYDAGRLVLGPLRRMLMIVAAYSTNPLAPPPQKGSTHRSSDNPSDKLGTFETEQLINTVTKITDLLRKCWGVAGAGIISSNLARQEGGLTAYFNPTVPGKAVYALFAFVAIDNFKSYLHCLQGDIMILINDVAAILHEEVYRWGYEDKGQCNKNLGATFLMVYKIGAVSEVVENRKKAEQVIFSSGNAPAIRRRFTHHRTPSSTGRSASAHGSRRTVLHHSNSFSRSNVDNIDLSSLPGIQSFADRALLGLLKTFAGIHRDKTILTWNDDFRLGAGVRPVSVELFFGMDSGWAVEGAVGSSYKIDATYLSPHVNMASRMMSATKQYGVFLLLSQKVQGLLSVNAQNTLRHIDTVTVKGSTVQQKIFTYDMKVRNDFFLYSKTESQSDLDSERYSPLIWDNDQDLCVMRSHVSEEFLDAFNQGRDEYLSGRWKNAIELLKLADKLMFEEEVDEGYTYSSINENLRSLTNVLAPERRLSDSDECNQRLAMGDGPCQRLIAYMNEFGGEAPSNWAGYRPLTSK